MASRSPTILIHLTPDHDPAPANDARQLDPCLTIEQLEEGLRMLDRGEIEPNLFWDQKTQAFRQTVVAAIAETSSALSSNRISSALREELERQVEPLNFYLRIADSYLAGRQDVH